MLKRIVHAMNPTDNVRFDPHTTLAERSTEKPEEGAKLWMNTREAARLLGVSARGVQRRCQAGTLLARRVQGERREVWEVESGAVEQETKSHSNTRTRATQRQTKPTTGRRVAVNSSVPHSSEGNNNSDSDSDTASLECDSDTIPGVAFEAGQLRAQLQASRAETARERELNAFLKSQIEEGNRNAAELRKALNEALKIAPRQLEARRADQGQGAPDGQQRAHDGTASGYQKADNGPRTSAEHEKQTSDGSSGTLEIGADELLELCRRISQ